MNIRTDKNPNNLFKKKTNSIFKLKNTNETRQKKNRGQQYETESGLVSADSDNKCSAAKIKGTQME